MFDNPSVTPDDPIPANKFAEVINKKLATSKKKDIFIYVPGVKVIFENPILVASELWHFQKFVLYVLTNVDPGGNICTGEGLCER